MRTCSECGVEYDAALDNFSPDKRASDGLQTRCKVCKRVIQAEYHATDKGEVYAKTYGKKYYATINGYLHCIFASMTGRCSRQKTYLAKGIKNKFISAEHLIGYVVEVLKVDPRGLVCHRIDNDGHYEEGNIQFLTDAEHREVHK